MSSVTAESRREALSVARAVLGVTAMLLAFADAPAQSSHDSGTPAESRSGTSGASAYAPDKLETVNLSNGNLSINLPLVSVGGRGSASFGVILSYNSKVWSSFRRTDPAIKDQFGQVVHPALAHYYARYNDPVTQGPNRLELGGGWSINLGPVLKVRRVDIDRIAPANCSSAQSDDGAPCGYKYVLTKAWLVLPDGSEVELRDNLTDGAPSLTPVVGAGIHARVDRDRGRVWRSTDGSFVTLVLDAGQVLAEPGLASGWVFLADGTRLRMEHGACTRIIDRNGNVLTFRDAATGEPLYTDQLGRQVYFTTFAGGVAVNAKGYGGVPDRVITINTGMIGADVGGVLDNLRADFRSLPRPFTAGDYFRAQGQNDVEHAITTPHTDLFTQSEADPNGGEHVDERTVVTGVQLPDGRGVRFRYNQFGEVAEVVYPGGGVSRIEYGSGFSSLCAGFAPFNNVLGRRVVERRLLTDGVNVDATWFYSGGSSSALATIEARKGDGTAGELLLSEKHYFLESASAQYQLCTPTRANGTGYSKWQNSKEYRVERQTGAGTEVTVRQWEQRAPVVWPPDPGLAYNSYAAEHGQEQPPNDPRVAWEETTLENGRKRRVEYSYGEFNNVTSVREYDFGDASGSTGALRRQTVRTYVGGGPAPTYNGYCYTGLNPFDPSCGAGIAADTTSIIHLRRLPLTEEVLDGQGNRESYAEFEYDSYRSPDWVASPPQVNAGMIQYDGSRFDLFDHVHEPRGNLTSVKAWVEGGGGGAVYATSFNRFDNAGNVVASKDRRGYVSTASYADDFGDGTGPGGSASGPGGATYAFATVATNALGHQVKTQYDYTRGVPTGVKDANGVVTRTEYDLLARPVRTTSALGLAEQSVAETTYPTAADNVSLVSTQLDATRWLASKTEFDGFDRPVTAASSEDGQHASLAAFTIFVRKLYDPLGRVRLATNPYRAQAAAADGWTRTTYDMSGRVSEVARFAGGASSPPADAGTGAGWMGSVVIAYAGEQTVIRDEAGKQRRSTTDGLGRLISVDEMYEYPSSGVYATTGYDFDARGNLKAVHQGQQTRTFTYDGLSRLRSASNPETCQQQQAQCSPVPISYSYDLGGNLSRRTDANGLVTTYAYDAINRVTGRTYSDSTPAVAYFYDSQPLPPGAPAFQRGLSVGRLVGITYGGGALGTYTGQFDAMGRAGLSRQVTEAGVMRTFEMSYEYDLAGNLRREVYPSGRVVRTEFDATGRVAGMRGGDAGSFYAGGAAGSAESIQYTAGGKVLRTKLGNGLWERTDFNSRLQPTRIRLGTSAADSSVLRLDYTYGVVVNGTLDPTKNNGNIQSQTITVPDATPPYVQRYSYDAVNRLESAEETAGAASTWKQVFAYDIYGNRSLTTGTTYPTQSDAYNNPAISPATNRITSAGYRYDGSGNLLCDAAHPCAQGATSLTPYYSFDAENRLRSAGGGYEAGGTSYTYDGEGRRVRKATSNGAITVFVYDTRGRVVAEYSDWSELNGTRYLTTDHLGSTRVVTDKNGAVESRHDYFPYGEEAGAQAGRTSAAYSKGAGVRQKFTGKGRDNETGLDFFVNRYYSPAQGRFTTYDPVFVNPNRLADPQRLNLYVYSRNNPLKYVDPDGTDLLIAAKTEAEARSKYDLMLKGLTKADRSHTQFVVGNGKNGFAKGTFGVTVDKNHKSESGNFQTIQRIANAKDVAVMNVVGPKETTTVLQAVQNQDNSWSLIRVPNVTVSFNDTASGYAFFPHITKPRDLTFYSTDSTTQIYTATDAADEEIVATMYHEMRHVVLGDFGRTISKAEHPDPVVEKETKAAEDEAKKNYRAP